MSLAAISSRWNVLLFCLVVMSASGAVGQTAPTITWPTPAAITYGTALSATQLDATATISGASIAGTFVYTPASGTVPKAGLIILSTTFTPTDTTDYKTVTSTVQLQVTSSTSSTGTVGSIPMFIGASSFGNSAITQASSNVGIGVSSPVSTLDVYGITHLQTGFETSNAVVIGPMPANLDGEYAVHDQPAIIVNGEAGGASPNFNGNSIAIYDFRNSNDGYSVNYPPPSLYLGKSRSGVAGTPGGIVLSGDVLGALSFVGDNGANFGIQGAYLGGEVDGTPSSTSIPGRLTFGTTASGSGTPTERMRITSAGLVGIGTTAPAYMLDVHGGQVNATGYCINSANCITAWPTGGGGGSGTVTSITAGTGLTGGTITGAGTIGLNMASANSWTAAQTFSGGANFPASGIWTSSGALGIGTMTPAASLDVNGILRVDGSTNPTTTAQGAYLGWNALTGSAGETDLINNQGGGTGGFAFMNVPSSGTPRSTLMYITGAGNAGIGTTAPGAKLEVDGSIKLTASSGGSITFQDGTTQSTAYTGVTCGGDYAESVDVAGDRKNYEPGDVLVLDPDNPGKMLKSIETYSTSVSGIYSTKPGTVGRRQTTPRNPDELPMAVVGIVPAKVSAENGRIKVGDLLVTSSTPGYAMKGTDRGRMLGAIVGKAMANLDSGKGVIEVLVSLQ